MERSRLDRNCFLDVPFYCKFVRSESDTATLGNVSRFLRNLLPVRRARTCSSIQVNPESYKT